jgi:ammonium transporter, Amt family
MATAWPLAPISGLDRRVDFLGFNGVGAEPNPDYAGTIPHLAFAGFQMMFAIITPALITGAFVERVRFKAFLIFSLLWATLVYDPVAHWVWGVGGFFRQLGALDFAGGTVVHVTAGFSALAFAMVIGSRKGFGSRTFEPHNIPYSVLGAGPVVGWLVWLQRRQRPGANGVAVNAFITTNTAAAAAGIVWMFLSWKDNKPSVLGIVTGAVVGLVAITPAAGFVTPLAAIAIGAIAAPISYYAIRLRQSRNLDESLDVWACHGMGGTWGALATGIFATEAGTSGLLILRQPQPVPGSAADDWDRDCVCLWHDLPDLETAGRFVGLRVSENEEEVGLDISEHGEKAYA